jgi:hypothetical protein
MAGVVESLGGQSKSQKFGRINNARQWTHRNYNTKANSYNVTLSRPCIATTGIIVFYCILSFFAELLLL